MQQGVDYGKWQFSKHRQTAARETDSALKPAPHLAGAVIARKRPGTANGFVFLSLEDETGISNAIIDPHLHERSRVAVTRGKFLRVEGTLQNQGGVISVKASVVRVLDLREMDMWSHDFH